MNKRIKIDRSGYLFDNKALVTLIIPLIVEQLLAVLVGMADSIMIASVGEAAVSGVSLVDQVMVLLINIFAALATGGAVVAGQYLGHRRREAACESATQLVWFITVCAVVITVVVYAGKSVILHGVFGKIEPDVMRHADIYLMIVTMAIPFMALYNSGAAIFRAMGNSKISMQVSIIMNIINVAGNAILIYGFHRGTEGVAIPTLVSRIVAAVIIIVLLIITHIGVAVMVFGVFAILPLILKAYHLSDVTAEVTRQIIYFHGLSAIVIWPASFTLPSTFRASGDAKACMIISMVSMWIFRIVFSYILGKYLGLGVFGIWVAMVVDWAFRALCFIIRYFRGGWKKQALV